MVVFKYSAAALTLLATTATIAVAAMAPPPGDTAGEVTWKNVLECFNKPNAIAGCLESRMERAVHAWRETTVRMARSDPDTTPEDAAGVGDIVQQIGDLITYGIGRIFPGEDAEELASSSSTGDALDAINGADEGIHSLFIYLFLPRLLPGYRVTFYRLPVVDGLDRFLLECLFFSPYVTVVSQKHNTVTNLYMDYREQIGHFAISLCLIPFINFLVGGARHIVG